MFGTKEVPAEHYTGKESHIYVEKLIKSSKELLIISPYIDVYYANFLKSKAGGKKIKIISSSIDKDAEKVLYRKSRPFVFCAIAIVISILLYEEYVTFNLNVINGGAGLFLILASGFLFLHRKHNIELRKPKDFVHVKLYIAKDSAIQGSANLTYNGMRENVEHISVIKNPETISKLHSDFDKIWETSRAT